MKCEICHEADAETVLKGTVNGEARELYVCAACAAAARDKKKRKNGGAVVEGRSVTIVDGQDAPPLVQEFFKAAIGLVEGLEEMSNQKKREAAEPKACPRCRATWEQIEQSGRFGCPECWRTFAAKIKKHVLRAEYGPAHKGAMPPDVTGEDARAGLERELAAAVRRQDYEKAAAIQKRLAELDRARGGDGEARP